MTDRQMTAWERLAISVAGIVIAAAIVGVYTTMQAIQHSQADLSRELAVVATEVRQTASKAEVNRERIQRIERNRRAWEE